VEVRYLESLKDGLINGMFSMGYVSLALNVDEDLMIVKLLIIFWKFYVKMMSILKKCAVLMKQDCAINITLS
jgi:hypothetical protein